MSNLAMPQQGIPKDFELQAGMEERNGLIYRNCLLIGRPSPCGHYVTTIEKMDRTGDCRFTNRGDQAAMVDHLRHLPRCALCLADTNSYLFPAWNMLSDEDVAKVIKLYEANYPKNIKQPYFYSFYTGTMGIRMTAAPDPDDGDGELNLATMEAEFFLYSEMERQYGEAHIIEEQEEPFYRRFDLARPEGWQAMLMQFPQPALPSP